MKPKIGIIVCGLENNRQFVSNPYIQCIKYAGGLPLVVPLVKSTVAIEEYAALCDGFLFCGGNDITPLLFGEEPKDGIGETNITLDLFQIRIMKEVLKTKKPIFSICRGMQILNVACGGSIYQDISLQPGYPLSHMQHSQSRQDVSHKITCKNDSILKRLLGRYLFVNSYHHQTIGILGTGLYVSATANDGTIEAIEKPDAAFVLGVQWHPECMYRTSIEMRHLFSYFVNKCLNGDR